LLRDEFIFYVFKKLYENYTKRYTISRIIYEKIASFSLARVALVKILFFTEAVLSSSPLIHSNAAPIIKFSRIKFPAKIAISQYARNTPLHHTRVTQLKERQCGGWRQRSGRKGCCACGIAAPMHRLEFRNASPGRFVRRERRERGMLSDVTVILLSFSSFRPYSCHSRHPLWTFDRSHPRCLPLGAQSRATTEIRLAIIADDKVEQCRTPVSRRTAVQEEEE